jgi:hypothetical protein
MNAEVVAWNMNNYKESGVLSGSFYGKFDNAESVDEYTVVCSPINGIIHAKSEAPAQMIRQN